MQRLSTINLEKLIDCHKRPRTGRGSQGGRMWRSLRQQFPRKSQSSKIETQKSEIEAAVDDSSSFAICEIHPLHILNNIHQSGVNCLHISDTKHSQNPRNGFSYNIVSGGDDQALHCLTIEVKFIAPEHKQTANCRIQILSQHKIESAHSSAIKGRSFSFLHDDESNSVSISNFCKNHVIFYHSATKKNQLFFCHFSNK